MALVAPVAAHAQSTPEDATRYVYDEAGRLRSVTARDAAAGSQAPLETALYKWDAVGNLLAIERRDATQLALDELSPGRGVPGDTVTLSGAGYANTTSGNVVRFNGTAATVTAATPRDLVVTVPAGATTGTVSVTTGGTTAASEAVFKVVARGPHVSSATPGIVAAGQEVTLTGSGFEPTRTGNGVKVNTVRPVLDAASETSLRFKAPSATGSGAVQVRTPSGTHTGPDLFIPPDNTDPAAVADTGRLTLGQPRTVSLPTPGKVSLSLFDGEAGRNVSLRVSESTFYGGTLSVYKPDGSFLTSTGIANGDRLLDTFKLPATGTYTAMIGMPSWASGSAKLTAYDVPDTVVRTAQPSAAGTAVAFALETPGHNGEVKVAVEAGQSIAVASSGSTIAAGTLRWVDPNGNGFSCCGNLATSNPFYDSVRFTTAGTYTLLVDPEAARTGSVNLTLYDATEATGSLTPATGSGGSMPLTLDVPGKNGRITFDGTAGQSIAVRGHEATFGSGDVYVYKPDGSYLTSNRFVSGEAMLDTRKLPSNGTYTVLVDPGGTATGTARLSVYDAAPQVVSATPSDQGASVPLALGTPGQNAEVKVRVAAGESVSVATSGSTIGDGMMRWFDGAGNQVACCSYFGTSPQFYDAVRFTAAGTYTLLVDPQGSRTGSITLKVHDATEVAGSLTPAPDAGASLPLPLQAPGRNARITFAGSAGDLISLRLSGSTIPSGYLYVYKPDGSYLTSNWFATGERFLETFKLPATGTYTVLVDPSDTQSGTATLTAYSVTHALETATATDAGTSVPLRFGTPGQNANVRVTVEAGQSVSVTTSGSTIGDGLMRWFDASANHVACCNYFGTYDGFYDSVRFAAAGTYSLSVDPEGARTGTVTVKVHDATDVTGTIATDGTPMPLTLTAPGRNARPTFTGTAGQQYTLALYESTIASGMLYVYRPDGNFFDAASFGVGERTRTLNALPATGSYTVLVDPSGTSTGTANLSVRPTGSVPAATTTSGAADLRSDFRRSEPAGPVIDGGLLAYGGRLWSDVRGVLGMEPEFDDTIPALTAVGSPRDWWSDFRRVRDEDPAVDRSHRRTRRHQPRYRTLRSYLRRTRRHATPPRAPAHEPDARHRNLDSVLRSPAGRRQTSGPRRAPARYPTLASHDRRDVHRRPSPANVDSTRGLPDVWRPTKRDRGTAWESGWPDSEWAELPASQAETGQTAVGGQALNVNGEPLSGVTMQVEGSQAVARTDRTGRFLLRDVQQGERVLIVDGRTANRGRLRYGQYEIHVDVTRGKTTTLEQPVYLAPLDPVGDTRVPRRLTRPLVVRNPRMPGFEVRIPAGSRITDADGNPVRKLNLTGVPTDRPPFALPPGVTVSAYFTIQPGRAYLSKGAQIVYPNYHRLPPGQRVDFWNYDPDDRGWYVYGKGEVTEDGRQIVPDPHVRVWELTGAMAQTSANPPRTGPNEGDGRDDGDPVDLQTGLFVYEKTDLVVNDVIPVALTRTYRPGDDWSYGFGRGTTTPWDLRLWTDDSGATAHIVLPNGGKVRYEPTSERVGNQPVYAAKTPGPFRGSKISYVESGSRWELALRDGAVYEFAGWLPVSAIRDRFGNRVTVARIGLNGPPTQITTQHGRWIKFSHDTYNRITRASDNAGRTVLYTYNEAGYLSTVTDANGGVTDYTYDEQGRMTHVRDARGITYLTNEYDARDRVTRQTLANGGHYTFGYTDECIRWDNQYAMNCIGGFRNIQTRVYDPRDKGRYVDFDDNGLPTRERRGARSDLYAGNWDAVQETVFERDSQHRLTGIRDPLGRLTRVTYDPAGNVLSLTTMADTAEAATTRFAYTSSGQLSGVTDALENATQYGYDEHRRLRTVIDASGRTTLVSYDGASSQPARVESADKIVRFGYEDGDLVSVRDGAGNKTRRYVDAAGRVTGVTDPLGRTTKYAVDDLGLVRSVTDPQGNSTTLRHDPNGNLIGITDARGNSISATYDVMDRLASWTDPLNRTQTIERDRKGNPVRLTDRRGQTIVMRYDDFGRLSFAGFGASGEGASQTYSSTLSYGYDRANRLTRITDSSDGEIVNSFDGFDRLKTQTTPRGSVSYGYDKAGRRTQMSVAGAPDVTYAYDPVGRLTAVDQGVAHVGIGYDAAGRRASTTLPNGITQLRTYDAASRVTGIRYDRVGSLVGDIHYARDAAGRATTVWGSLARTRLPDQLALSTYDAANRLTQRGNAAFAHDENGNLLSDGLTTYAWNDRGQLASATGSATTRFGYDGLGRRARRVHDGTATDYVHDGSNVVSEHSGGNYATNLTGLELDDLFARSAGGHTRTALRDALGSVVAEADADGVISTAAAYGPFGEGSESKDGAGYTGREPDSANLIYYRHRYYSPAARRFLSEDPAGLLGGDVNLYAYVGNDPVNRNDPTGLFWNEAANAFVGGMDGLTFGITSATRDAIGVSDAGLDKCGGWYSKFHTGGRIVGVTGLSAYLGVGYGAYLARWGVNSWASSAIGGAAGSVVANGLGSGGNMSAGNIGVAAVSGAAGGFGGAFVAGRGAGADDLIRMPSGDDAIGMAYGEGVSWGVGSAMGATATNAGRATSDDC